jgi:hypothetical protein
MIRWFSVRPAASTAQTRRLACPLRWLSTWALHVVPRTTARLGATYPDRLAGIVLFDPELAAPHRRCPAAPIRISTPACPRSTG